MSIIQYLELNKIKQIFQKLCSILNMHLELRVKVLSNYILKKTSKL